MTKPSKTAKSKKTASYAIKKNQICKLNGTRYVPVTDPQEIATAKIEIAKQLGIGKLFEQVEQATEKVNAPENTYAIQDELAKQPSVIKGQATRMAANNMWASARINHEIKLLGDKIAQKIHGHTTDKRDIGNYCVPSLFDVLACTEKVNTETEEVLRALHQYVDENL